MPSGRTGPCPRTIPSRSLRSRHALTDHPARPPARTNSSPPSWPLAPPSAAASIPSASLHRRPTAPTHRPVWATPECSKVVNRISAECARSRRCYRTPTPHASSPPGRASGRQCASSDTTDSQVSRCPSWTNWPAPARQFRRPTSVWASALDPSGIPASSTLSRSGTALCWRRYSTRDPSLRLWGSSRAPSLASAAARSWRCAYLPNECRDTHGSERWCPRRGHRA
mmetsp:Transcript_57873/g.188144  ORF Transcript_57873/g.188144 Transcript_57873/m.188144 type:complete len:226 (+) Transcript_57873:731-1408(+)